MNELLFDKNKYTGTKKTLSLLFIILVTIFIVYGPPKLIAEIVLEVLLIIFISYFIAKILFYNKQKQLKTTITDKILISCSILLIVFNTVSIFNDY
ncbi:MAG: hypothetical protein ACO1OT_09885 [Heyndrickxia sp.]